MKIYSIAVWVGLIAAVQPQFLKAEAWNIETLVTGDPRRASLALNSSGIPNISYDASGNLGFARKQGSSWLLQTVDSADNYNGSDNSLDIDSGGYQHIAYSASVPGGQILKYAKWTGSAWSVQTLGVGGNDASLDVDSNNRPHIAHHGDGQFRYVRWTGSAWSATVVDPDGMAYASLKLTSSGDPKVVYTAGTYTAGNRFLKFAEWNGSAWNIQTIEAVPVYTVSMVLDAGGNPHIVYREENGGVKRMKYAKRSSNGWSIQTLAQSTGTIGNISNQFSNGSIALDSSGNPCIAYSSSTRRSIGYTSSVVTGQVRYAKWTGTAWATQNVSTEVANDVSLAIDASNKIHIAYTSLGLRYATAQTVSSQNLVSNPGFESGKTAWAFPATVGSIDSTIRHGGTASAKIVRTTQGTSTIYNSPRIAVTPNTAYNIEAWMKRLNVTGGSGAQMSLEWFNGSGGIISNHKFASNQSGTADWNKYAAVFTSPSGAATARVKLYLYNAKGTAWYDDVVLVRSGSGGAMAALALAPENSVAEEGEIFPDEGDPDVAAAPANIAAADLSGLKIYPNPYQPGSGGSQDGDAVTFKNLTAEARITLYSISGEKVAELNETDGDGVHQWDARGSGGEALASGVYVYRITNPAGERKTGRIAVIR